MEARLGTRFALAACALALVAAFPAPSAGRGLSNPRAEAAAKRAVREDASFRRIAAPDSKLRTRRCRHVRATLVRCTLYAVVPNPCALDPDPGRVCVQALWERRWIVEVRRRRDGGPVARILRVSSGPAVG